MPIIINKPDPYSLDTLTGCWAYCASLDLDFNHKVANITYHVFKDKASAYANKPPIKVVTWKVKAEARPPKYGPVELLTPYVAPVYADPTIDPDTGEEIPGELISAEVLPVYSEPEIVENALPSFGDGVNANAEAYSGLMSYFDAMALSRPEFIGGEIEGED